MIEFTIFNLEVHVLYMDKCTTQTCPIVLS